MSILLGRYFSNGLIYRIGQKIAHYKSDLVFSTLLLLQMVSRFEAFLKGSEEKTTISHDRLITFNYTYQIIVFNLL